MQDNRNKRKNIKKSSKIWRESPRIKKGISKEVYKGKREKLGKWPWREKSKKEKEGIRRGEKGRDADRSKREAEGRGKRIRESKYNIHYRNIVKEKLPKYLEGRMKWKDRRILARFRCGNETKAREYRKEEGEKRCRLCKRNEEDLRHVIEECEITGGPKDIGKTLNETGEGLAELKAIIEKRNDRKDAQQGD